MIDDKIRAWREEMQRAPWDTLTERRVLDRVLAQRLSDRHSISVNKMPFLAAAAAVLLIAGLWLYSSGSQTSRDNPAARTTVNSEPDHREAEYSHLGFLDGSSATYLTPAEVEVEEQSPSSIRLRQRHGQVRYQVEKVPARSFIVVAAGIEIRVVGTIFVVAVDAYEVKVSVERGEVVVDSASGTVELTVGEDITLTGRNEPADEPMPLLSEDDEPLAAPVSKQEARKDTTAAKESAGQTRDSKETAPIGELMLQVDLARQRGDNDLAAELLRRIVRSYPRDSRVVSVLFTLGKVERRRGRYEEAAEAFGECWRRSPNGTLAEDAHFQEAISFEKTGQSKQARDAAGRYLDKFPDGPYAGQMRKLLN